MAEEHEGKALLIERCARMRRWNLIKGAAAFSLSSLLLVLIAWNWQGGADWLFAAILTATGLYGFVNLMSCTRLTDFENSPVGRFLSGKSGKYELAVLLIRHSDERQVQADSEYGAYISFVDKSGARTSVSIRGREECGQVTGYLKERLAGRCVIMEMTFDEYDENRRAYLQTR